MKYLALILSIGLLAAPPLAAAQHTSPPPGNPDMPFCMIEPWRCDNGKGNDDGYGYVKNDKEVGR